MYTSIRSNRWLLVGLAVVAIMVLVYLWKMPSHKIETLSVETDCLTANQVGMVLNTKVHSDVSRFVKRLELLPDLKQNIHKNFNIFKASEESKEERASIDSNKCVPMKTPQGETPICVYDPKIDEWVSGYLVSYGIWEKTGVCLMTSILKENPDMQVMDVGCNMGVFTLQAAKMGREVISVDVNKVNLRLLSKSLKLGGLQNNVMLIWNAISNVYETIELTITYGNIGASFIKNSDGDIFREGALTNITKVNALSITLNDLIGLVKGTPIFMKIDIEGSEWKAFTAGERFFREVDVRFILMEWTFVKLAKRCDPFARFISGLGYKPYEATLQPRKLLSIESSSYWPNDILWVKN